MLVTEAQANIARRYVVADGYNGDTAEVGLTFLPVTSGYGIAIEVTDSGYYRANDQHYSDAEEMLYYYDNHASAHFRQVIRKLTE